MNGSYLTFEDIVTAGANELSDLSSGKKRIYRTGIKAMDTVPFVQGTINYLCSRPGQGKTRLIMKILTNSVENNLRVVYYQGEDNKENTGVRLIQNLTNYWAGHVYNNNGISHISPRSAIESSLKQAKKFKKNCFFCLSNGMTIDSLLQDWSNWEKKGANAIFFDYVQTINVIGKKNIHDRHTEIAEKIRDFIVKSKMFFIGILQLNRDADKDNQIGSLKNLFGSSSYEMTAHSISFITREKEKDSREPTGYRYTENCAICIVKNRLTGIIKNFRLDNDYNIIRQ